MKITPYKANLQTVIKLNSSTTVPVRITDSPTFFSRAWFIGNKAAQTANTGTVYIGDSSANSGQPLAFTTGTVREITAPTGSYLDLYDFFLDVATTNDGIVVLYITP